MDPVPHFRATSSLTFIPASALSGDQRQLANAAAIEDLGKIRNERTMKGRAEALITQLDTIVDGELSHDDASIAAYDALWDITAGGSFTEEWAIIAALGVAGADVTKARATKAASEASSSCARGRDDDGGEGGEDGDDDFYADDETKDGAGANEFHDFVCLTGRNQVRQAAMKLFCAAQAQVAVDSATDRCMRKAPQLALRFAAALATLAEYTRLARDAADDVRTLCLRMGRGDGTVTATDVRVVREYLMEFLPRRITVPRAVHEAVMASMITTMYSEGVIAGTACLPVSKKGTGGTGGGAGRRAHGAGGAGGAGGVGGVGGGVGLGRASSLLSPHHGPMMTHVFSRLREYAYTNVVHEGGMDDDSDGKLTDEEFSEFAKTWKASSLSSFNNWTAGFPESIYPTNAFRLSTSPAVLSLAALFQKVSTKNVPHLFDAIAVLAVHGLVVFCHSKVRARELD